MGSSVTPLHREYVWQVQEALERAVGKGKPGSDYEHEVLWWRLKVGDVLPIEIISDDVTVHEQAHVVDLHDRLDDFTDWSQPKYYVIQVGERHFRVTGRRVSHEGENWDWIGFEEVVGTMQTRRSWGRADS